MDTKNIGLAFEISLNIYGLISLEVEPLHYYL